MNLVMATWRIGFRTVILEIPTRLIPVLKAAGWQLISMNEDNNGLHGR